MDVETSGEGDAPLDGGFVNVVSRVGDTVRRTPPACADYVHDLLRHLEVQGWPYAPRFLGVDELGRETLSWIGGEVPWPDDRQRAVRTAPALARVATLVRELHDLTAGTPFAAGSEVACHRDLSPRNTVYRDGDDGLLPTAFLDWDDAAPGRRVDDLAHVCWQFLGLGRPGTSVTQAASGIRLMADAYGLTDRADRADRADLVPSILRWQEATWQGIEAGARQGTPAMVRLRDAGAVDDVRAEHRWSARHAEALSAALDRTGGSFRT